VTLHKLDF